MRFTPVALAAAAVLVLAAPRPGRAQIVRLDLARMVERTDEALVGEIVGHEVFAVDHPSDGSELYFTRLTLEGASLRDGRVLTHEVLYPGGFVDEERGTWNSEAPSADDVRLGNRVVVFSRAVEDLGGGVAGNVLYAFHGGLYRTHEGPEGPVVLGRGDGYAIAANRKLGALETAVRELAR